MEKYESILKFKKYEVNEIYFKRNMLYTPNEQRNPINLKIEPILEIKDNNMDITLEVIIYKNAVENNKPFEMKINITGYFIVEGNDPERFKANAIAIMYPYIRAIVSTYTASANVTPLILPAINVNKLIEEQNKKKD